MKSYIAIPAVLAFLAFAASQATAIDVPPAPVAR